MDKDQREYYQWLQVIVYFLKLPDWPFAEKLSREQALTLITNFLNLDPQDPELIFKADLKLSQILAQESVPSIPPNIKELVEIYEKHLTETQAANFKLIFPLVSQETELLYQKYQEKVLSSLQKEPSLADKPIVAQIISQQIALNLVRQIPAAVLPQNYEPIVAAEIKKPEYGLPIKFSLNLAKITYPEASVIAAKISPTKISPTKIPTPAVTRPTLVNLTKKIIFAPLVKPLQLLIKINPKIAPEIKIAILKGLTAKEIQVKPVAEQQQIQQQLAEFESAHKTLTFIFKNYQPFLTIGLSAPPLKPLPVLQKNQTVKSIVSKTQIFASRIGIYLMKLLTKPEASIIGGAGMVGLSVILPLPQPIKLFFSGFGGLSTAMGILSKKPTWFGKTADFLTKALSTTTKTINTLLSSLTVATESSLLPVIGVIGGIVILAVITLMVVITSGSTFVPTGEIGGGTVFHLGKPVDPRPPAQATHLAENVIYVLNQCGITNVTKTTWPDTQICLQNSTLPNKELMIQKFSESTNNLNNDNMLQCVGFVRGIMAALGKDLGPGRPGAKDFLNPPTPADFYPIETNMEKVQIGDLVIMAGSTDGHIAIVIDKIDNQIRVAEVLGPSNGRLLIEDINPVYYNGFLRPK